MENETLGKLPKLAEVFDACSKKRFVLLSGPRRSGKTICALQKLCDHAWNVKNANILVLCWSQSAGLDAGVWADLVNFIIPEFGLKITKGPYVQAVSKKAYVEVRNKFGQNIKIQLGSLKDEKDAEKHYKGKRYTMIFVTELDNFKKRKTFDALKESLRGLGVPDKDFLFLGDTNPAEEGDKSWIYKMWFEERNSENFEPKTRAFNDQLGLVEFQIGDNIFLSEEEGDLLRASYAHDPDLYARYIDGKWVTASIDALFYHVFKPGIHIMGERTTRDNPDPEILVPDPDCLELISGWDMGVTNSAFCILEKWFFDFKGHTYPAFNILDELVIIGEDFDMAEFVLTALGKMLNWEEYLGREVHWTHWSDRSVFDMKDPIANRYQHEYVYDLSNGKIELQGAVRTREMVRARIDLTRKLLFQDRLFVSANCTNFIEMFKGLKKGKSQLSLIQTHSPFKHSFDCGSYAWAQELFDEIQSASLQRLRPRTAGGVLSVGL